MPKASPSVLIIRLDGIGDALALTPLLAALNQRGVPADVVLRPVNAGIFSSRAARRIVTAEFTLRSSTRANVTAIHRLGNELRRHEYTHVLVATEDPGGYRLAAAIRAPVRIGFADFRGKPLKALWSRRLLTSTIYRSAGLDRRAPHECDVLFELAGSLLGKGSATRDPTALRPLVLEHDPAPNERIAVQVTDKWERLGIPQPDVVDLIARAGAFGELHLLSARREMRYADEIAAITGLPIDYFDDLEPWKRAIGAATAIITPDSGALHVAGMVSTPVVAIFPRQRAYALRVARWAPWAAPHRIVRGDQGWPQRAGDALAQLLAM